MPGELMNDLVILVPDKNMEAAIKGILSRHQSLSIRQLDHQVLLHPARDSGCLKQGHDLLRPFANRFAHSLVLFDREGCGRESQARENLETQVEKQLRASGWGDRAAAVVIDPELEIWVWSKSPHVPAALGWESDLASLREWLIDHHFWRRDQPKPDRPKEAMEKILRIRSRPRSSSIYSELAQKVGFQRCHDPAFLKLRAALSAWFPA
jgi:hypothetical protein